MLTAGAILKKERVRQKISLDKAVSATKIQKHYIEALESDSFDRFPSSVYAKGFLQNYAKYLGIDQHKVVALYRRSVGETAQTSIVNAQKPIRQPLFVLTPTAVILASGALLVAGTFGYLVLQFYNFQKPPLLNLESPDRNMTTNQEQLQVKGKTEPDLFITVNDEAVSVSREGKFEVTITLSKGTNTIIVKAKHPDNIGKEAIVTRNVEYKPDDEITEDDSDETSDTENAELAEPDQDANSEQPEETNDEIETAVEQSNLRLELHTSLESSWIEVYIDGEQELASIALPDTTLNFTADESIHVVTGKVYTTSVKINGEPVDFYVSGDGVGSIFCEIDNSSLKCYDGQDNTH
ncbi:MAG: DUF4115 domain-containing protein [Patescibacteria group bacterium]|nr:DUF4115 domain-containing protein [Patescibacteria group bacterium]